MSRFRWVVFLGLFLSDPILASSGSAPETSFVGNSLRVMEVINAEISPHPCACLTKPFFVVNIAIHNGGVTDNQKLTLQSVMQGVRPYSEGRVKGFSRSDDNMSLLVACADKFFSKCKIRNWGRSAWDSLHAAAKFGANCGRFTSIFPHHKNLSMLIGLHIVKKSNLDIHKCHPRPVLHHDSMGLHEIKAKENKGYYSYAQAKSADDENPKSGISHARLFFQIHAGNINSAAFSISLILLGYIVGGGVAGYGFYRLLNGIYGVATNFYWLSGSLFCCLASTIGWVLLSLQ